MNVNVFGPHQWRLIEQLSVYLDERETKHLLFPYRLKGTTLEETRIPDVRVTDSYDTTLVRDPLTVSKESAFLPSIFTAPSWCTFRGVWESGLVGLWTCFVLSPPCHLCAASMAHFFREEFRYSDTLLSRCIHALHDHVNRKLDRQCIQQYHSQYHQQRYDDIENENDLETLHPFLRIHRMDYTTFRQRLTYETAFTGGQIRFEDFLSFLHLQFAFFWAKYDTEPWAQRVAYYLVVMLRILFVYSFPFVRQESPLSGCFAMTDRQYKHVRGWLRHEHMFPHYLDRHVNIDDIREFLVTAWTIMIEQHTVLRIPAIGNSRTLCADHYRYYMNHWAAKSCSESRCL
jgi:hypothetical protein